jgi:hypothetical protein
MTLYAKLEANLRVALDSEYKQLLWEMVDDSLNQIVRTTLTVHSAGVASIAALASYTVPMGDVTTGAILLARANQQVALKFNGGTDEVTLMPQNAYPGMILLHGAFTGLVATNKDASDAASLEFCIVGV